MNRNLALTLSSWQYFTADESCRFALKAYYAACRSIMPPSDDPDPETWSSSANFQWAFVQALIDRVNIHAAEKGVNGENSGSTYDGNPYSCALRIGVPREIVEQWRVQYADSDDGQEVFLLCSKWNNLPPTMQREHNPKSGNKKSLTSANVQKNEHIHYAK